MCPKSQKIRVNHKNTSKIRVFFLKYSYIRVNSYKYERLGHTGEGVMHCTGLATIYQKYHKKVPTLVGDIYKVNLLVFQIQWHSGDKIASWWNFKAQKAQSVIFW